MTKFSLFAALTLAASVVSAPALAASPLEGTWATETKTQFGVFKSALTVAEKDGAATVTIVEQPGSGIPTSGGDAITDVKIEGNTITFKRQITVAEMPIALDYTATVEGDALTGTALSPFGAAPITGTRQ